MPRVKPGENTSFGALKQIDAGLLNVGCAEASPANAPAAVLAYAGYRVVVPYLRGYGTTRFLSVRRSADDSRAPHVSTHQAEGQGSGQDIHDRVP